MRTLLAIIMLTVLPAGILISPIVNGSTPETGISSDVTMEGDTRLDSIDWDEWMD